MASVAALARSRRESSRSTSAGVARSPLALMRSARVRFDAVAIGDELREIEVGGVGLGDEVEQVEGASAHREVGGDGRHDAAGRAGDHEHAVGREAPVRAPDDRGLVGQGEAPALAVRVADLDRAGIADRLGDQTLGHLVRVRLRPEVDRLDQRVRPLTGVGLGEARDRATHRSAGAIGTVAVVAAQPGGAHEERASRRDVRVQLAHCRGEQLHPYAEALPPGRAVEGGERTLVVERRKPVHAGDRGRRSPGRQPGNECVAARGVVDHEGLHAECSQFLDEGAGDAAVIGDDDHAAVDAEGDAGRRAVVQRRAQDDDRDTRRGKPAGSSAAGGHAVAAGAVGTVGAGMCRGGVVTDERDDVGERGVVAELAACRRVRCRIRSRMVANSSACLTVSMPRSASRSRSRASMSAG